MDYAQTRQASLQRKEELLKERERIAQEKERLDRVNGEIERELIGLDQVLEGLEFLNNDTPPEIENIGFTEHIRRILQQTTYPLTAVQVRDSLLEAGVSQSSPKVLLISVHTILGRLESDLTKSQKDGKPAYIWKNTPRRRRHLIPSGKTTLRSLLGGPLSLEPLGAPPTREKVPLSSLLDPLPLEPPPPASLELPVNFNLHKTLDSALSEHEKGRKKQS